MNSFLQDVDVLELMTKGKPTLIQKDHFKGTRPKQLETHNVSACDVENTSGTNKKDLRLLNKPRTVRRRIERMPQMDHWYMCDNMPAGRPPLSQPPKPAHGHPIVKWFLSSPTRGISHCFEITQDTTYTTERLEEKKNKQART